MKLKGKFLLSVKKRKKNRSLNRQNYNKTWSRIITEKLQLTCKMFQKKVKKSAKKKTQTQKRVVKLQ